MKKMQLDSSLINKSATDIFKSSNAKTGTVKPSKPSKLKNLLNNFFSKYRNLPTGKKILVTIIYCVAIVAIGGGATYLVIIYSESGPDLKIPSQVSASETDESTFTTTISSPMPLPPRDNLNPINGELYTAKEFSEIKSKYPIAVVIENHVDARPQSGYNSADLVFETLAEGGITRTLAIFWGKDCPEMGPIRSARQYFLEWLVPFDPVFMFIGYAYSDSGDLRVDSGANMVSYGIKRLDTAGSFWRSNQRAAPHNAYSSSATLYQKADALGFTGSPNEIESWKFKKDAPIDSRGTQTIANIIFMERLHNAGRYDVKWVYDRERNVYLRSNGNTPYTDANTGAQVYAKNVIIQRVEMISTFDFAAHIIITTIGSGDAVVLRDGQVINGTWEKETLYTRTRYLDAGGNEIELNRGNTWVEGVPIDQGSVQIDN